MQRGKTYYSLGGGIPPVEPTRDSGTDQRSSRSRRKAVGPSGALHLRLAMINHKVGQADGPFPDVLSIVSYVRVLQLPPT